MLQCTVDPYPMMTDWDDTYSHEYPEHWIEEDGGPVCVCEDGWLPLIDGGAIECHVCGGSQ